MADIAHFHTGIGDRVPARPKTLIVFPSSAEAVLVKVDSVIEPLPMIEPVAASMSDQEWEAWKSQYWREEKLRAKNERFLSMVSMYVDRVSELMHQREDVASGPAADAVASVGHVEFAMTCLRKFK